MRIGSGPGFCLLTPPLPFLGIHVLSSFFSSPPGQYPAKAVVLLLPPNVLDHSVSQYQGQALLPLPCGPLSCVPTPVPPPWG